MKVIAAEKDKNFDKNALINITIRARHLDWQQLERLWKKRMLSCAPINMHHYDTPGNLGFDPKVQCIYYCSVYCNEERQFNEFLNDMKDMEDIRIKCEDEYSQAESMLNMLKTKWM